MPLPRRCTRIALFAALVGKLALPVQADAAEDKTLSPYFLIEGDPAVDRLPLSKTRVKVDVVGVIADVKVTQTYQNRGTRPIHASYVFPGSTRAAVHGMRMTIGERVIVARIEKKEEAAEQFDDAKQAGKSASLLEQARPNVFRMSVANILPGDIIEVELRYTELLRPEESAYRFVYPTVTGPRYASARHANAHQDDTWIHSSYLTEGDAPTYTFDIEVTLSTGIDVQALTCDSHEVDVEWRDRQLATVTLDPSEKRGGNRDFILSYVLAGNAVHSGLLLFEDQDESFFLLMAEPPKRVESDDMPRREYVFIVDVSGSMHGFPLDTAKVLMRDLVGLLRPTDTFNMILFSGASSTFAQRSVPATDENVRRAIRLLDTHQGGGGTELLSGLQTAMSLPHEAGTSRSFVVVTDGYIGGERESFRYIRDHLGEANVFAFGIGTSVNRYLIEGVAKAGFGEPFVVSKPGESAAIAQRFKRYVGSPVLTGVRVDFDGFKAYDVVPESVPDVLAERPIVVFGKYAGKPNGKIALLGLTGQGRYNQTFDVAATAPTAHHRALSHLWARQRIADLSDLGFDADGEDSREEVTALGLRYSLLTKHTSFVAIHETPRNTLGAGDEVTQPLPLPHGVSNFAVGGMTKGSEPPLLILAALLFAVALAIAAAQSRRRRAS